MRYFAAFLMAVALAFMAFALPASAHESTDNTFFYNACAVGVHNVCPILEMDVVAGVPAAQYQLALLMMRKGSGEAQAATLIYQAAMAGYPPAVRIWNRVLRKAPAPVEPDLDQQFTVAKIE